MTGASEASTTMTCTDLRVLVFDASLRRDSHNRRLALLAADAIAATGAAIDRASFADFDCPSFNGDLEEDSGIPPGATRFEAAMKAADAFMIASPEYNGSMPGALKNLIDWASRFRPQPFNGRQGLLLSASPSMAGGNRGLWALRIPLEHLGARIYPDMFSLAQSHMAFQDDGQLKNDVLERRLHATVRSFLELVEAAKHYPAIKKQWIEFLGEHPDAARDRIETSEPVPA
jgi:chromate reductase